MLRSPLAAAVLLLAQSQGDSFRYRFDSADELADFEVRAGSWTISAGSLWCTSQGAADELRWRRDLSPSGSARLKLVGAGVVALDLCAGKQATRVRLDRGAGRVAVELDGKSLIERAFEPPTSGPVALAVRWKPLELEVRAGDDEPLRVARDAAAPPFTQLRLLSIKSTPRFDELSIERDARATPATDAAAELLQEPRLTEEQRIAVEQATKLADEGDPEAGFERLARALPAAAPGETPRFAEPVVVLLERLATRKPALRAKSPLKELIGGATIAAQDGSASLVVPLRPGWKANAAEIRRTDGPVFTLASASPQVAVEIYRYDQKLKYWFGRDPAIVYSSGGGGPTLGRARADDLRDQHPGATVTRPFGKSRTEVGDAAYEHALAWPDPAVPDQQRALREYYVLHRGDTWRVTIEGTPLALELAQADLDWLLASFRFTKP